MAEQLSSQGWVSVLIDPENELESLYGDAVADTEALRTTLTERNEPIVVVNARDAGEFVPYGRAILDTADQHRKPIFVVVDEGQLFSANRRRGNGIGEAADVINEFAERGRKRALDLFITALRYTGTLQRTLFANKNLTLVGWQVDPTAWSALAPQFKTSKMFRDQRRTDAPARGSLTRREFERFTAPWPGRRKGPALRTGPARAGFALAPAGPGRGAGEG